MGAPPERTGSARRANHGMHLPTLTHLSAGRSTPVPDDDWLPLVEAALVGDPPAIQRLFAAAARWANRLIHSRPWLSDAEAEVIALMWTTLPARPRSTDEWRTLVRRRLARRQFRPSPEVVAAPEALEPHLPGGEFETAVVDQLAARARLAALGPLPPGLRTYAAAVLCDDVPSVAAAHCARQWRYLRRRAVA
jgi:hypothetical protein